MQAWVNEELDSIDLGDERLNERSRKILESFFGKASSSINGSFQGWKEVKAAYRFFDNDNVSSEPILQPHYEASMRRIEKEEVILCVSDTTILDYSHRKERLPGLGHIYNTKDQGFLLHPTIAFNKLGICLGALDNKSFIRESLRGKKGKRIIKPIEEKESMRWIESYRLTNKIAKENKDKLFINIADGEGDFYEFLSEYKHLESASHIIVRAKSDRVLSKGEPEQTRKLWSKLKSQKASGKVVFKLDAIDKKRKARTVTQTIKFCKIKLDAPQKVKKRNKLEFIEINAVLATEENPPSGREPIERLLFTTP